MRRARRTEGNHHACQRRIPHSETRQLRQQPQRWMRPYGRRAVLQKQQLTIQFTDLEVLQQAKASQIKSDTFTKELDKQIARTVIEDDDTLSKIDEEIDQSNTRLGEFPQTPIETPTV